MAINLILPTPRTQPATTAPGHGSGEQGAAQFGATLDQLISQTTSQDQPATLPEGDPEAPAGELDLPAGAAPAAAADVLPAQVTVPAPAAFAVATPHPQDAGAEDVAGDAAEGEGEALTTARPSNLTSASALASAGQPQKVTTAPVTPQTQEAAEPLTGQPPATAPAAAPAEGSPATQAALVTPAMTSSHTALPAAPAEHTPGPQQATPAPEAPAVTPQLSAVPATAPVTPQGPAPTAQVATPHAPTPVTPRPLATQLAGPTFALTQAGEGTHVMTMSVNPENIGPVTVRAHITGNGVQVELFAPADTGREALRAILVDLRRDLAGLLPHSTLNVSTSDSPPPASPSSSTSSSSGHSASAGQQHGNSPQGRGASTTPDRYREAHQQPTVTTETTTHASGRLDVLA